MKGAYHGCHLSRFMPSELTELDRIIEYINKHEGVEWMTLGEMAREFAEGRIPGWEVEGGSV